MIFFLLTTKCLLLFSCQFVVDDSEDYSIYSANQDLLVEWKYVEEVRLHVSMAPSCPICLHPPTAAKVLSLTLSSPTLIHFIIFICIFLITPKFILQIDKS